MHLGKVFAGVWLWFLGFERVFSSTLSEWLKGPSAVVPGILSSACLWAGTLINQKGSRGLYLLLPAWIRRSKRINQETSQHFLPVFTEITVHYKCLCIFYSTLKSNIANLEVGLFREARNMCSHKNPSLDAKLLRFQVPERQSLLLIQRLA